MKLFIIFCFLITPSIGFSQVMHLPGAYLPPETNDNNKIQIYKTKPAQLGQSKAQKDAAPANVNNDNAVATGTVTNSLVRYNASVVNTNFTIPLVRVNFLVNNPPNATNSQASTSFFNSVGAGVNYSWGELDRTTDSNGNDISIDYYNHWGFQAGFLFASNGATSTTTSQTPSTQPNNIFAVVAGVSVLNFQLGAGYELGSLATGQRRGFLTISYAIPMSVLVNGGYKIIHANPIPANKLF